MKQNTFLKLLMTFHKELVVGQGSFSAKCPCLVLNWRVYITKSMTTGILLYLKNSKVEISIKVTTYVYPNMKTYTFMYIEYYSYSMMVDNSASHCEDFILYSSLSFCKTNADFLFLVVNQTINWAQSLIFVSKMNLELCQYGYHKYYCCCIWKTLYQALSFPSPKGRKT